jgi:GTPase SAR1 family protein
MENYRSLNPAFYRSACGALLVFDLSDVLSFQAVDNWLEEFRLSAGSTAPFIILVGNKSDLTEAKVVQAETAFDWSRNHEIPYLMVSSLSGDGIPELMKAILAGVAEWSKAAHDRGADGTSDGLQVTQIDGGQGDEKKGCC